MQRKNQILFDIFKIINLLFIAISVVICSILMLVDLPGVELLETNPNWLLIWLVSWSIQRTVWQGAIAGLAIGWIYDGISLSSPSHAISFVLVAMLTSAVQKHRYLGEDFISVAFVVFFMSVIADTIFAWQYAGEYGLGVTQIFQKYQQVAPISAIISSLWSPAFYYPFNSINKQINMQVKKK